MGFAPASRACWIWPATPNFISVQRIASSVLRIFMRTSFLTLGSCTIARQSLAEVLEIRYPIGSPVAHLVEFGTVERTLDEPRLIKLGDRWARITTTGFVSPNPFLRRAWHAMKMPALGIFAEEMKNELYKSAGRLAKRAAAGKLTAAQVRGLSK